MNSPTDPNPGGSPFRDDSEGLWSAVRLDRAQRGAIRAAFCRDPELRGELEVMLRRLTVDLRGAFVTSFAEAVRSAGIEARPTASVRPALEHTIELALNGNLESRR